MKVTVQLIIPLLLIFAFGCDKPNIDISPPVMEVVSYAPQPVEEEICGTPQPIVFLLQGGEALTFDVIFKDDVSLSQYKVDIHNNFDCHGHGGGSAPTVSTPSVSNQTTDWTVLDIQDISGESSPVIQTLQVPENVTAGNYHFLIQVIDAAGNDSPFTNAHSLKIINPLDNVPPQIHIQQPASPNFSMKKGEGIRFTGQVIDNRSLSDGGNGLLYLSYTDLSSGNTFTTNQVFPFDENIDTTFDFDFDYTIPQTLVAGNYRFSLGANDGVRNVAPFVFFEVEVSN